MIETICRDTRFDKSLEALRLSGKKGTVAADRAEAIIAVLARQGHIRNDQLGPCLRQPDARLSNCIKYYLGNGFRMITVDKGADLYLLYIGAHDACHRWVENNRNFQIDPARQRCIPCRVESSDPGGNIDRTTTDPGTDAPFPDIDDRLLREIFAGLCGDTAPSMNRPFYDNANLPRR